MRDNVSGEHACFVCGGLADDAQDDDAVANRGGQVQARAQVVQDLKGGKGGWKGIGLGRTVSVASYENLVKNIFIPKIG